MDNLTLSYSLTLPQSIYPHLDYLMSINKRQIKNYLKDLWNNETLSKLTEKAKALAVLKKDTKRTDKWIPSRVYRNSLELTGQILRSQIERKQIYEFIANHPCTIVYNENYLAKYLEKSPLFILNIQRQLKKQIKKGYIEKDYLKAVKPDFNADIFISSADDSIENGQFKKLEFYKKKGLWFMKLKIKLPITNQKFKWFEIKKAVSNKIAKLLNKEAKPKAPLIKKELLSNGYEIFKLIIPFEIKINTPKVEKIEEEKLLSIDLSPSENRLAVATVVEEKGHSKPAFFKAKRIIRKIDRIQKEIDRLEKKIDHIANNIHTTTNKTHKEELQKRLQHLYQEQKRKQKKIKQIRKEVLEIFTNWIIEYARSYGIKVIAIEKLSFKNIPNWKISKAIKRFTDWFYSKVKDKLEYKAKIKGIKIIEINPANTSRYCHKCGEKGKAEKLVFKCECGEYDRDYNASVNIGKRAIKIIKRIKEETGKSKSQEQGSRDTPARNPFRQGLASFRSLLSIKPLTQLVAYSSLVEVSAIKLKKLSKWIDLHDYGYG
ncbi:zinc ribbon domain-containing protein [Sulfurihydrogenibium subterraneum]|uniref:zinc ribbon domain-containing protein n=1 Tax=Sulfurihydrogenibium subterraneum TaxID=171121 RepID=UPI00048F5BF0|nr:zinc ribbon domain-containing protein [Sulfurihydrogenibium subterraneum]